MSTTSHQNIGSIMIGLKIKWNKRKSFPKTVMKSVTYGSIKRNYFLYYMHSGQEYWLYPKDSYKNLTGFCS